MMLRIGLNYNILWFFQDLLNFKINSTIGKQNRKVCNVLGVHLGRIRK